MDDFASRIKRLLDGLSSGVQDAPKEHRFWNTQPVASSKFFDSSETNTIQDGPIKDYTTEEERNRIQKSLINPPPGFQWGTLDIENPEEREELYSLLNENYVEDADALFRFDYPQHFLEWALKPPGWHPQWHVALRYEYCSSIGSESNYVKSESSFQAEFSLKDDRVKELHNGSESSSMKPSENVEEIKSTTIFIQDENCTVPYNPGNHPPTAHSLSRNCNNAESRSDSERHQDTIFKKGQLVAFVSAIPMSDLKIRTIKTGNIAEVNFLCVHKTLRSKGLTPLLIKEITRRVNLTGIHTALYTAGIRLPGRLATAQYFHRPLDFATLVRLRFAAVPPGLTLERMCSRYALQVEPSLLESEEMRPMEMNDLPAVKNLMLDYMRDHQLVHLMSDDEIKHWLLPRPRIIYSYVLLGEDHDLCQAEKQVNSTQHIGLDKAQFNVDANFETEIKDSDNISANSEETLSCSKKGRKIVAFVSFYALPSSVCEQTDQTIKLDMQNLEAGQFNRGEVKNHNFISSETGTKYDHEQKEQNTIKAAYLFYYSARDNQQLKRLINAALHKSKEVGFHVFNCLDILHNNVFLEDLRFCEGDGTLNYYLYNWNTAPMIASDCAVMML